MKTSRLGALLELSLELVDLGALAADHDAGTRGADDQAQLVTGALDFDRADAGSLQLLLQLTLQLDVFDQQLVVVALNKPARPPRLVDAEPKSIRMDFLSHSFLYFARLRGLGCLCATAFFAGAFFAAAFFAAGLVDFFADFLPFAVASAPGSAVVTKSPEACARPRR